MPTTTLRAFFPATRITALRALLALAPAFLSGSEPAVAQVLQDGDLVVNVLRQDPGGQYGGRFLRVRGQNVTILFEEPANSGYDFEGVGDFLIDSAGRVVFTAGPCGNSPNNTALLRWDPATGLVSQLLCLPNIVPPGGPPPGFPIDATHFDGIFGLHLTRSLRVSIDDDVNGGMPQAGYVEAYAFAVRYVNPQTPPMRLAALRYRPDTGEFEPGFAFIEHSDGRPLLFTDDRATYYAIAGGSNIYRAEADLGIDIRARTTVGGADVLVSGSLRVAGRNELAVPSGVLDNTDIANGSADCGPAHDDNVPWDGESSFRGLTGIMSLGVLNGGIFACSNSGAAGFPWLFDLAARGPFLNPYACVWYECRQHYGPYRFFQEPPNFNYSTVHGGRVLGTSDSRVFAVSPAGYEVLANDPLLFAPKDVAAYPAETPALASATVVVRVDSPINVLVTDAAGQRIGYDADGNPVNDYGAEGSILALGPEGHPVVCAIINPAEGAYTLDAVGTGDGPYTIRAYRAETTGGAALASLGGTAAPGVAEIIDLRLSPGMGVSLARRCPGDVNVDQLVDLTDLATLLSHFGALSGATWADGDLNGDAAVDLSDLSLLLSNFGAFCP
ncbi:MAG: hypothetical protein HZB38_04340 [Planctomycetes bacterium]|nr:hypothetical protein [Planctomycetota bacterium]